MQRLAMIAVLLLVTTSGASAQRPTVVLQAGLGDGHESWSAVSAAIAAEARVFAYDRPGYGGRAPVLIIGAGCKTTRPQRPHS